MIEVGFVCTIESHSSQVKNCMIFLATNYLFKTESHLSQIAIVDIADIFCCYTCMCLYYSYKESSIMLLLLLLFFCFSLELLLVLDLTDAVKVEIVIILVGSVIVSVKVVIYGRMVVVVNCIGIVLLAIDKWWLM